MPSDILDPSRWKSMEVCQLTQMVATWNARDCKLRAFALRNVFSFISEVWQIQSVLVTFSGPFHADHFLDQTARNRDTPPTHTHLDSWERGKKRISDDWNSFPFYSGSASVSDKSRGGYCGNTHPFSEIKLPPSQEIDWEASWKWLLKSVALGLRRQNLEDRR